MKKVFLLFLISLCMCSGFSNEIDVQEEFIETDEVNTVSDSLVVQVLKSEYFSMSYVITKDKESDIGVIYIVSENEDDIDIIVVTLSVPDAFDFVMDLEDSIKNTYLTSFWDFMIASEEPSKHVIRLLKDADPEKKYYSWEENGDGRYYFFYDLTK